MKLTEYIISKLQASVIVVVNIENVSIVIFFLLERSINVLIFFLLFRISDNLCATRVNLPTTQDITPLLNLFWTVSPNE